MQLDDLAPGGEVPREHAAVLVAIAREIARRHGVAAELRDARRKGPHALGLVVAHPSESTMDMTSLTTM